MRIVLEAFGGKLRSDIMDVPENTSNIFKLALTQPVQIITSYDGEKIGENGPIQAMCEFEWTGKSYAYGGSETARIYVLKGINKSI